MKKTMYMLVKKKGLEKVSKAWRTVFIQLSRLGTIAWEEKNDENEADVY